ncbi:MAG: HNH endonuclease signature motif containing protein [Candidatus Micrarchaeota archaeon]
MSRETIPSETKREVLIESGFRCAVPTCRTILTLDIHHIIEVSEDGGNEASNLIPLCPNCHALYHRGIITRDAIKVWKGVLISLNAAFDKDTLDNLLFLSKVQRKTLALSGDGVLKFSKLLSAGLAQCEIIMQNGPIIVYDVFLTEKGRRFVEAWKTGREEELRKAISEQL